MYTSGFPVRRFVALFVAGVLAGLVGGCSPATVESIQDEDYDRPVETLYMVSAIGEKLDDAEVTWLRILRTALIAEGIDHEVKRLDFEPPDSDGPSLEETSLDVPFKEARSADATQVLVVEEQGEDILEIESGAGSPEAGGRLRMQVFDVSLFDADTEKRVWRATIKTSDGFGDSYKDQGRSLARKMANTLIRDGFLPESLSEPLSDSLERG